MAYLKGCKEIESVGSGLFAVYFDEFTKRLSDTRYPAAQR
jgi:hypothetical protein